MISWCKYQFCIVCNVATGIVDKLIESIRQGSALHGSFDETLMLYTSLEMTRHRHSTTVGFFRLAMHY